MSDQPHSKVGLVGVSGHMEEHLIPSILLNGRLELFSAATRDVAKAERLRNMYGIKPFRDWRDLMDDDEIDAVVVAGPPDLNSSVIEYGANKKLPVFSEKPAVHGARHFEELILKIGKHATKVQVGYNFRLSRYFQNLLNLQESLGLIEKIEIDFHTNKPRETLWDFEEVFDSFLHAIAVHPIEMACCLTRHEGQVYVREVNVSNDKVELDFSLVSKSMNARIRTSNRFSRFKIALSATYSSGVVAFTGNDSPSIVKLEGDLGITSSRFPELAIPKLKDIQYLPSNTDIDRDGNGYQPEIAAFERLVSQGIPNDFLIEHSRSAYQVIETLLSHDPTSL